MSCEDAIALQWKAELQSCWEAYGKETTECPKKPTAANADGPSGPRSSFAVSLAPTTEVVDLEEDECCVLD